MDKDLIGKEQAGIELVIEKGVPISPLRKRCNYLEALAIKMEVGDSIMFHGAENQNLGEIKSLLNQLRKHKKKYTCRRVDGGYRVWRL